MFLAKKSMCSVLGDASTWTWHRTIAIIRTMILYNLFCAPHCEHKFLLFSKHTALNTEFKKQTYENVTTKLP